MRGAVYNEFNPAAVHILREMIRRGVIAPGDVDDRSIADVGECDYDGYAQVHLFAGGGFWSIAARQAGWEDERFLWTVSCPCQPFSSAGKGGGTSDPRHLWPHVYRLLRSRRQRGLRIAPIVGEQVASKAGVDWFDGIRADMGTQGIRARSVVFPACAVNAPHQRQRQYWFAVADSDGPRLENPAHGGSFAIADGSGSRGAPTERLHAVDSRQVVDTARIGWSEGIAQSDFFGRVTTVDRSNAPINDVGHAVSAGRERFGGDGDSGRGSFPPRSIAAANGGDVATSGHVRNPWSDAEWITCHDGKKRRTKSGIRLLVNGLPGRVDLWSVAGNAIVPEAAVQVIAAVRDVLPS